MECEKYKEMISVRLDGELSSYDKASLENHLKTCDDCRNFQEKMAELNSLAMKWQPALFPPDLEQLILSKARKSTGRPGIIRRLVFEHYHIPKGLAWAAMILIVALTATLFSRQSIFTQGANHTARNYAQAALAQKVIITEENVVKTQTISDGVFKLKKGS